MYVHSLEQNSNQNGGTIHKLYNADNKGKGQSKCTINQVQKRVKSKIEYSWINSGLEDNHTWEVIQNSESKLGQRCVSGPSVLWLRRRSAAVTEVLRANGKVSKSQGVLLCSAESFFLFFFFWKSKWSLGWLDICCLSWVTLN